MEEVELKMNNPIATLGNVVEVTPWDDTCICVDDHSPCQFISDRRPFSVRVTEHLYDGQIFFGICGLVIDNERFADMICSLIVRADGADWRESSDCQALYKIGRTKVARVHEFDFRHPDGTVITDFPYYTSIGGIRSSPNNEPTKT